MRNMFVESLRHNYDLTPASTVFDIGGYKGQWADLMYSRYGCHIYCFEPVFPIKRTEYKVFNFGLGGSTREENIHIDMDKTGIFCRTGIGRKIQVMDIVSVIDSLDIKIIDLMKINIEGMEYELLPRLINSGYVKRIKNLQIQFHNIAPTSDKDMYLIQEDLKKTHTPTWQFRYVWENWLWNR